jgi:uncharacterized peroxidase-related enzyme
LTLFRGDATIPVYRASEQMGYLREEPLDETNFPLFAEIKNQFGFIPNFFRAQTIRTDLIEAQDSLANTILVKEGALTRQQKEYVFLVCSAANLSTYCVTAHCEMVRMLGIEGPEPEQIAVDHTAANIPMPLKALLNFAKKLNSQPTKVNQNDIDALRTFGYADEQILETVVLVGLAKFSNYVAFGLGTLPDFDSIKVQEKVTTTASR